ncbi:helix-hairpin-helix domain-containing protein [SAR92 clade bacterium H455]|uniref:Helix-hairpin-helix domain-containing protein n=1 Tax=SAR92 clade bacterium H455 TaxID=2974818 RepID=A0ABY5TQK1_9GAMM|nr:helix-hairpin-helix domain-containing protein [SAR92 clade bacterium H455]
MLETSKKMLLIGASLIALAGSAPALAASAEKTSSSVAEQAQQQVNINSASAADIAKSLKGIGLKTAEAIVAYRDAHGAFKSLESITMVKGVGSKTLKKNSARILLK